MIRIENVDIFGWKAAIRGARNPMNSWEKSDSLFLAYQFCDEEKELEMAKLCYGKAPIIKENDHKLLMNLAKGGSEEAKWRRMVHVQMDITAPLYWWKEFETYKVGTVSNSCSTMHKIHARAFTLEDFSCEHLGYLDLDDTRANKDQDVDDSMCNFGVYPIDELCNIIDMLNHNREKFLETKDKRYWWQMIQLLPSSYNQRRTIDLNYEVLAKQYRERKDHKLDCWRRYCDWIKSLPYSEFITLEEAE